MTSKRTIRKRLTDAIALNDAREVEIQLFALVYHGAEPYTLRGISDAGLTDAQLNEVYEALPPRSTWKDQVAHALLPDDRALTDAIADFADRGASS